MANKEVSANIKKTRKILSSYFMCIKYAITKVDLIAATVIARKSAIEPKFTPAIETVSTVNPINVSQTIKYVP
jgi:hypothetical protein